MYKIAVINGSLRKSSTNLGLLRAIVNAQDKRFNFEWVQISNFELFNEDVQNVKIPDPIQKARDTIAKKNAILFGVPEYNHSVAAPLKNAYDWLSRSDPQKFCPLTEKPGAMVSSAGFSGGANAQANMRKIIEFNKMKLMSPQKESELLVNRFSGKIFDDSGDLIDDEIKKRIPLFLDEFADFLEENKH